MTKTSFIAIAALAAALLLPTLAAQADESGIRVDEVWARATPSTAKTGVIYLSITNTGSTPDTLVSASTPVAAQAELHETSMTNGVMQMRSVQALSIAPGKTVLLQPEGYHLMLMGLKRQLKEGEHVPLTLVFAHAGKRDVTASVEKPGALHPAESKAMPGMSPMPGMSH
ncbi:MAG TPA: copper chaperone PCu(A)C [Stellaceae bacterium]|nr:copper chaperone PCu(A)C [Stellaceae bacterium]